MPSSLQLSLAALLLSSLIALSSAQTNCGTQRCGTSWADANRSCKKACPNNTKQECRGLGNCWSDLAPCTTCGPVATPPPPAANPCAKCSLPGSSGGCNCDSQCNCLPSSSGGGVAKYVSAALFDSLFLHRRDAGVGCVGAFYTYESFIAAAAAFPTFVNSSDDTTNKRELAAFFGQISHETTGGWPTAPDGPYTWGLCFIREGGTGPPPTATYCAASNAQWPCTPGKKYYGRGPIQLSWNFNYGPCGKALGFDGLNNPEIIETDPVLAFKAAIYFWMTPSGSIPSCHDVMTNRWTPSAADNAANRKPGYGTVTNIVNGFVECNHGTPVSAEKDRVGYFKRYAGIFGVDTGANLYCATSRPF